MLIRGHRYAPAFGDFPFGFLDGFADTLEMARVKRQCALYRFGFGLESARCDLALNECAFFRR